MSDKISDEVFDTLPKKPNFRLIVILSGIAILVLFAAAYLLLSDDGKKLMHGVDSTARTTSYLVPAAPLSPYASVIRGEHRA